VRVHLNEVFAATGITSFIIPESVTRIAYAAFAGSSLSSITIGSRVTSIDEYAFQSTPLTSVIILYFSLGHDELQY
jgi:Na+/H+ antiporter NhaC